MKAIVLVGILLIGLGAVALGYQGFTYFTYDKVIDAGPVQVTAERAHTVWIPPLMGGAALAVGVLCVALGANSRKAT
jgi:hypothetical protein